MVVGRERAAQAQQDAGHVVLGDVAEGEADHQADHAGRAEHRADQRGRAEQVERQHQAEDHHQRLHQAPHQRFEVGVVAVPPQPAHRAVRERPAEQHREPDDRDRHHQQRDRRHQPHQSRLHLLQGGVDPGRERRAEFDLVDHLGDAVHLVGEVGGALAVGVLQDFAAEGHAAGVDRDRDLLQVGVAHQARGDRGRDAFVVLLAGADLGLDASGLGHDRVRRLLRRELGNGGAFAGVLREGGQRGQQQEREQQPRQPGPHSCERIGCTNLSLSFSVHGRFFQVS